MPQALRYNSSIEKAMDNLRAMGMKVHLMPESENEVFLFIDLESIMNIIRRRVPYPQKDVYYEKPFVVVHLWRG